MSLRSGVGRRGAFRGSSPPAGGFPLLGSSFVLPLLGSIVPSYAAGSPTPTFARACTAYVRDNEGVLRTVRAGCARFTGARLVQNLAPSTDLLITGWAGFNTLTRSTVVGSDGTNYAKLTSGGGSDLQWQAAGNTTPPAGALSNRSFVVSCTVYTDASEMVEATNEYRLFLYDDVQAQILGASFTLSTTPTRVSFLAAFGAAVPTATFTCRIDPWNLVVTPANGRYMYVKNFQVEEVTGQSVQTVAEYQSVGTLATPFQGCGVDGVAALSTTLAGAAIPATTLLGYRTEAAATQLVTPSASIRGLGDAAWAKVNTTAVSANSTGANGFPLSASRLTATAAGGTCLQALVLGVGNRTFSGWLRRITGTGTVDITADGTTFVDISAQLNSVTYTLVQINTLAAIVAFGFRFGSNTDAIDVDYTMFENVTVNDSGAGSPIDTTSTRLADGLSYPSAGNVSDTAGAVYAEVAPTHGSNTFECILQASTAELLSTWNTGAMALMRDSGGTIISTGGANWTAGVSKKFASGWETGGNKSAVAQSGVLATSAYTGSIPVNTPMRIGANGTGTAILRGDVRNLRIYSIKPADAQLTAMVV